MSLTLLTQVLKNLTFDIYILNCRCSVKQTTIYWCAPLFPIWAVLLFIITKIFQQKFLFKQFKQKTSI